MSFLSSITSVTPKPLSTTNPLRGKNVDTTKNLIQKFWFLHKIYIQ